MALNIKEANRQAVRKVAEKLYGKEETHLPHWFRYITSRNYREATRTANRAKRLVADMLVSSRAVRR